MKKNSGLIGVALLTGFLTACGGGGGSDKATETTPPNVPSGTISPELSEEFVPFEDQNIIDKIKDLISGETSNGTDYNVALGHMIGEVFADYPVGRTGRIVQIYNLGNNSIKYPNLLCSEVKTAGNIQTLTLKADRENCIVLDKTYRKGSVITRSVSGDNTTLTFSNVRYGSNLDFSLTDDYLISGSITYTSTQSPAGKSVSYFVDKLEFQRIAERQDAPAGSTAYDALSKEYLQVRNYVYSLVDDYGSGSNGVRTLSSAGMVIGQPYMAGFRYSFNFNTTAPFKMNETLLNAYKHLPSEGTLQITDGFKQKIEVKQTTPGALSATVYLNGKELSTLPWSTIIGSK